MPQQINLYQPAQKSHELSFGGRHVLVAILLVVIGHIIYSGVLVGQYYYLENKIAEIDQQKTVIRSKHDEISQQLAKYAGLDINDEIRKIEHLLANRKGIHDKLKADMFGSGEGFSGYFVAFARQHIAGVWITDVTLARAGRDLILKGQATAAHLVPSYLEKLSVEPLLSGTDLSDFELDRPIEDENNNTRAEYIDFKISTATNPEYIL